ncbi:hypothetical protein [Alkalicoccobacillus gibsonii]|uniref:hypothetical protein n=1 Tax=Alkalicoccobacillus gibsonii TaxID=79881 RepID=UPI0035191F3F
MNGTEERLEQMQQEIDELRKEVEELQATGYVEEKSSQWYWVLVPIMALSIPIIAILS